MKEGSCRGGASPLGLWEVYGHGKGALGLTPPFSSEPRGAQGVAYCNLGSEQGVVPEQGMQGLWPSLFISLPETGRCGVGQALSPAVIPCTTGIPKVPISLRHKRPGTLQEGRHKSSSHHLTALPPSSGEGWSPLGGRRDRGPTEEGERAPGHAWSPESGPGGNPRLQTPLPVKDVKKKKQLVLPFCLPSPSARPMAPPDCLRVGCAPSKWLPSSSAESQGAWDAGHRDLGRGGGESLPHWLV